MKLRAPVECAQNEEEFSRLLDLYRERAPKRVLEIGTWYGGTFYHWLANGTPGTIVVSVDLYQEADNSGLYRHWAAPGVGYAIIRGHSTAPETIEAARRFAPYDWIFIDGDHHEQQVRADWRTYRSLAAPGATIALHDITETADPTVEVAPFWRHLRSWYETTEFCFEPGRWGIGVVHLPRPAIPSEGRTAPPAGS